MARKKIPENTQADVLFKSDRECVVCSVAKRGDHIHHIDEDPSNNVMDNLALLCFDCHNDASVKGSLRKGLTPKTIKKYRDLKYQSVEVKRINALKVFNSPLGELNSEEILRITKNAIIILEVENIKRDFFAAKWGERNAILSRLNVFVNHMNFRLALDIFSFLAVVADHTRAGMTSDVSSSIYHLIVRSFPYSSDESDNEMIIALSTQCINMAFSLIYDSIVCKLNLRIAMNGLMILKYVYLKGSYQHIENLKSEVIYTYTELARVLQRPDLVGIEEARQLISEFEKDLEIKSLTYPQLPEPLWKLLS